MLPGTIADSVLFEQNTLFQATPQRGHHGLSPARTRRSIIDGKAAGVPVAMGGGMMGGGMMQTDAGRTGLATAMTDFMNSSLNKSGVASTNMTTLMQQLRTSDGQMR